MKKKMTEFPFASARRITPQEVAAAEEAVREQFGIEPPKRGRPAKDGSERYEPVSIRLHPKVLEWAKEQAAERGVGYQTVINETLLKAALPHSQLCPFERQQSEHFPVGWAHKIGVHFRS